MTLPRLEAADFGAFFSALWGEKHDAFPWQSNLLHRVMQNGWPDTLDLPTGSGKTAVLDIAVFALALDASLDASKRKVPLRTVFVIDRRVVVDQAYERAALIADKLENAADGVLKRVADRLRFLTNNRAPRPLATGILRGGMPRDTDWARRPDQPCILVSTIDQVGSRLLFRGYGITPSMRPVHAGLLGEDVLYLLDEVHLSRPFHDTLAAIRQLGNWSEHPNHLERRFGCVVMSATPGVEAGEVFALSAEDWNDLVLKPRLRASKPAILRVVKTAKEPAKARKQIAVACVREARRLFEGTEGAQVGAVIVNRVETARQIAELAESDEDATWQVHLVTGRMRPLDRDDLMRELEPRVRSGAARNRSRTLIVSTQAIEAGADFDFDVLVSECASLDALRQRFGRLNRIGEFPNARAAIIGGTSQVIGDTLPPDAVYGNSMARTWQWLSGMAETIETESVVDFGIEPLENRIRALPPELFEAMLSPRVTAPIMLPVYVDLWSQTQPAPDAEPDVADFLHGPESTPRDVQIVWRADLKSDWLTAAANKDDAAGREITDVVKAMLDACPPSALEAISIPLHAARAWLAGIASGDDQDAEVADVEGGRTHSEAPENDSSIAPVILWRGDATEVITNGRNIRPGVTIVVPAGYGGIGRHNWDPTARGFVSDRGDEAQLLQRCRAVLRWDQDVMNSWLPPSQRPKLDVKLEEEAEAGVRAARDVFDAWLAAIDDETSDLVPAWARIALKQASSGKRDFLRLELPAKNGASPSVWRAVAARRRVPATAVRSIRSAQSGVTPAGDALESFSDGDTGQFTGTAVPLPHHTRRVMQYVKEFAAALGIDDTLASDLCLAALVHDIGKIDGRCQLMLHDGDSVKLAMADEPLAKSAVPWWNRAERERVRRISGYPAKTRHELLSVALAERSAGVTAQASDLDLVLHLVASHHGHCRPFPPAISDSYDESVRFSMDGLVFEGRSGHSLSRIDSGVVSRFWRLTRRYGWWRLAWLESLLRLADHCASADEESEDGE